MQVVYVPYQEDIESVLLDAFKNRKESEVRIGTSTVVMPLILNFSYKDLPNIKKVLGNSFYRWITELRTLRTPSEAALDRFSYKIQRIVKHSKRTGSDIVVIFNAEESIDILRDELKIWIRTK